MVTGGGDDRVPLLDLPEAQRAARDCSVSEQLAGLSVFRVLLRHPAVAQQLAAMLQTLLFTGNELEPRLRELAIMRIGWRTGSVYEWTQHWRVARRLGVAEADLRAVRDRRPSACFSAADRAVLQATDDTLDHRMIQDAAWRACCQHLPSPEERIERVVALGNWTMFSQLLKSYARRLKEGSSHGRPTRSRRRSSWEAIALSCART